MTVVRIAIAVALLTACAAVGADEPKKDPPKAKEPARLDLKALGEMLTDMGYAPQLTDKDTFQKILVPTAKDGTYPVWLSVSISKQFVWMYTSFALPDSFEKAPAASWRKLLEKNDDIGPSLFSVDEVGKRLVLRHPIGNVDITPAQLRKAITAYAETITKNKDLWNRANFLPEMTADAKKLLEQFNGTWKMSEGSSMGVAIPAEQIGKFLFTFEKGKLTATVDGQPGVSGSLYLQIKDGTVWFDLNGTTGTDLGILKLEGDTLTMCMSPTRPTAFGSSEKDKTTLFVLNRDKK